MYKRQVSSREEFEFLHRNRFFSTEVPSDQIFELALREFEATALDQSSELLDVHLLRALLLNSVEESFEELIVLSFISELVGVIRIECSHQLTELILINSVRLAVHSIGLQVIDKTIVESLLSRCIIICVNWSGEQVLDEKSDSKLGCLTDDWKIVVRSEVE